MKGRAGEASLTARKAAEPPSKTCTAQVTLTVAPLEFSTLAPTRSTLQSRYGIIEIKKNMSQLTPDLILDALRQINDPDLHKDIVTLGFIKDLTIDGGHVSFRIVLTTPACPVIASSSTSCAPAPTT